MITTHGVTHWKPESCYGCKLQSLTFDRGQPKTHVKKGDPWKDNPVVERIQELSGVAINTDIPPPHLRKDK